MIMNILAIAILGGVAYLWGSKGGFSSLLNCVCVLFAGAIAFGLWEPTANWLISAAGPRGMSSLLADIAWGAGLAIPFALALGIFRAVTDGLIRKNLKFSPAGDWIVGIVFGVISGTIVSGICVLTLSGMRIGSEAWGYSAIESDNAGNIQRGSALWVPTDRITSGIYSRLSTGSFSTSEPLAQWNPDPAVFESSTRRSFGDGTGRTSLDPKDFRVVGRYVLDPAKLQAPPAPGKNAPAVKGDPNDVKADASDPTPQNIKYFDGETPGKDAVLHGVLVTFKAGAKERTSGQVVAGNGQLYLIAEDSAGDRRFFFPSAVVAKAEAGKVSIARFRYDAKDTFLASLGGDSESNWAFEFLVPAGFEPTALVVKGTRVRFDPSDDKLKPVAFDTRAKRDALVTAGQLTSGKGGGTIDDSKAVQVTIAENSTNGQAQYSNQIGPTLQDGTLGSSITVTNGRIVAGRATLTPKDLQNRGVDQNLRVDRYAPPESVGIFQIDVGINQGEAGLTGAAAREAMNDSSVPATPFIIDTNGIRYDAVGYLYEDSQKAEIRYSIGEPITNIANEAPVLSKSRPEQKMKLIFAPSIGTEIAGWGVGNKLVAKFIPPIPAKTAQR